MTRPRKDKAAIGATLARLRKDAKALAALPVFAAVPAKRRRLYVEMIHAVLAKLSARDEGEAVQRARRGF